LREERPPALEDSPAEVGRAGRDWVDGRAGDDSSAAGRGDLGAGGGGRGGGALMVPCCSEKLSSECSWIHNSHVTSIGKKNI
jgi:hypothetical protein